MAEVFKQQLQMATKFHKALKRIFDSQPSDQKLALGNLDTNLDIKGTPQKQWVLQSNLDRASDLVQDITDRCAKIQHMEEAAARTCRQVRNQITTFLMTGNELIISSCTISSTLSNSRQIFWIPGSHLNVLPKVCAKGVLL